MTDLFLCRASGEGSHNFRICADEAGVFAFYEEMTGRDQDSTINSITTSFHDSDYWSNEGTAFSLDLYMATFEVWKVDPKELIAARPEDETQERELIARNAYNCAVEECAKAAEDYDWGGDERVQDPDTHQKALAAAVRRLAMNSNLERKT